MTNKQGIVIWITGLAGCGKSTVAQILDQELRAYVPLVNLDGDRIREKLGKLGRVYDRGSRLQIAQSICQKTLESARCYPFTVVATISLFHEIQRWNKAHLHRYHELLVDVSLETLHKRDPHGLYGRYQSGREKNIVGLDQQAEYPENPRWIIDNNGDREQLTTRCANIARQLRAEMTFAGEVGFCQ